MTILKIENVKKNYLYPCALLGVVCMGVWYVCACVWCVCACACVWYVCACASVWCVCACACVCVGQVDEYYIWSAYRDTTVQTLTLQPTVREGVIVYEDSPLVRAVKSGHILIVDEADKAPTNVTCILKTLVESGEMHLADGRKIVKGSTQLHYANKGVCEILKFEIGSCIFRP